AANLSPEEEAAFRSGLTVGHKRGAYNCGTDYHWSRGVYVRIPFRTNCNTTFREYFLGAWVNDAGSSSNASNSLAGGMYSLWGSLLEDSLSSWSTAGCAPFVNYCAAVPNSSGFAGVAAATGSQFALTNDFTMHASGLPQNVFTFMLVGTEDVFFPNPGGSLGNLCVGGALGRFNQALQFTGASGTASHAVDLQAIPKPNAAPVPVQAGETLHFQWWHRDTVLGAPASNFTDGLRVTFI
ncbi:MAG: hypothetical protein P1V35_11475, partial [Planctomycetota bacterium]|nr:hypothetical protein [Planctomycetota bacterium]